MERYTGSLSPENIDVRRLSPEAAENCLAELWSHEQYREMAVAMLPAVDSTHLAPELRVTLGLPADVGKSATSIQAQRGPQLIEIHKHSYRPLFICGEAERNLWLSRYDEQTPKSITIFHELLEVKFFSLVLALPRQTFEYIDPSGRGHVFVKDIWYEPLPLLYPDAPFGVTELKETAGIGIEKDILEQIQWRANRHFSSKRYALVEAAAQIIDGQSGV